MYSLHVEHNSIKYLLSMNDTDNEATLAAADDFSIVNNVQRVSDE
jgi:hypothetical protein